MGIVGMSIPHTIMICTQLRVVFHRFRIGVFIFIKKGEQRLSTCNLESRPVPEPNLIESFLKENAILMGKFGHDDRVCSAYYRSHLSVIKHLKKSVHSTDDGLISLIDEIKAETPKLLGSFEDALLMHPVFLLFTLVKPC